MRLAGARALYPTDYSPARSRLVNLRRTRFSGEARSKALGLVRVGRDQENWRAAVGELSGRLGSVGLRDRQFAEFLWAQIPR